MDANGRSFEIHHVDGDRKNNALDNLVCVSIDEHYKIHYRQEDYWACASISKRMNMTDKQRADLSQKIRESNARHNAKKNKAKSQRKRSEVEPAVTYYMQHPDKTIKDTAKLFKCSQGLLRTVLNERGLTRTKGSYMMSSYVAALSYEQVLTNTSHLTCREASKHTDIHPNTVAVYRRLLGIKSRNSAP